MSLDEAEAEESPASKTLAHPSDLLASDPGSAGRFGEFGGCFIPETLVPACQELEEAFREAWADDAFRSELDRLLADYAGRPSPLTVCEPLWASAWQCRLLSWG